MKITKDLIIEKLPERALDSNKGIFGKALIIAGSKNFPGAAILSVLACAKVGAGLVTLTTSPEVYKIVVPKIPFATFLDFSEIEKNLEKYDAVLIGPGLGKEKEIKKLISELVNWDKIRKKKLVFDADGLNILSETKDWYQVLDWDFILTPHPGEMARLTGLNIKEIQENREEIAKKFSKLWNKTVVLKGAKTVIANPFGEIFISPFANPLLATAGTGDVLAGIIAGLLAQGLNLPDASIVGVFVHGMAGEKMKEKFGDRGATSLDVANIIPEVLIDLKQT